jgi:DNA repair photolyase
MKIKEIQSKTCMVKSKLTDYVINPYTGCQHGCVYCYADFIKRFQKIKGAWGSFAYAKVNCPELLPRELEKNKPGNIWLSSVCDCYMPVEAKFKLTRKILETISKSKFKDKFTIEILTKSALVKRDFDLLKNLNVELGMSINSLDDKFTKKLEPLASPPRERVAALEQAKKQDIKIFGFISPVMIFTDLEDIFKEFKRIGCAYVWIEIINRRQSTKNKMLPFVKKNFPKRFDEFKEMFDNYEDFCAKILKQARALEKKYKLKIRDVVVH